MGSGINLREKRRRGLKLFCELCNGKGERFVAWPMGSIPKLVTCCDCEGSGELNENGTPKVGEEKKELEVEL